MILQGILDNDLVNYKKICMVLEFPYCNFKCGKDICQNYALSTLKPLDLNEYYIINMYISNPVTEAIVMQGLEPFDSADDLFSFIKLFRYKIHDDIVIYTGYTKDELDSLGYLTKLKKYDNIIIKYGRYIPNQEPHFDEVLGVKLASDNQYAERIS